MAKNLYEILVPANANDGTEYDIAHHKRWDEHVRSIAGGLTIFKPAKGQLISPQGELFLDRMIPVRILCERLDIERIIDFTMQHYDQKAVLAYAISTEVILRHRAEQ